MSGAHAASWHRKRLEMDMNPMFRVAKRAEVEPPRISSLATSFGIFFDFHEGCAR